MAKVEAFLSAPAPIQHNPPMPCPVPAPPAPAPAPASRSAALYPYLCLHLHRSQFTVGPGHRLRQTLWLLRRLFTFLLPFEGDRNIYSHSLALCASSHTISSRANAISVSRQNIETELAALTFASAPFSSAARPLKDDKHTHTHNLRPGKAKAKGGGYGRGEGKAGADTSFSPLRNRPLMAAIATII